MSCRAFSFSDLATLDPQKDSNLEGITANVKLLLKLIQDHNEASNKDDDNRKLHRVAGMITILDNVKSRIEKSQQVSIKRAQFRRCNTELRRTNVQKDKKPQDAVEENEMLRRELYSSVAARKNLEKLFSSLGKEKEIMVSELARKAHEMNEMEQHLNDFKEQNEKLLAKVQACGAEHEEKVGMEGTGAALQERNKLLSEQLLRSLDGYRSLTGKLRDSQEENAGIHMKIGEIEQDVAASLDRIHDLRERVAGERNVRLIDIEEELSGLERMFQCFEVKAKNDMRERSDCVELKSDVPTEKTGSWLIRT